MSAPSDIYTDDLIDAIDDWQAGSRDKARKAERLTAVTKHLPANYRTTPPEVFRQVRTNAQLGIGIALDAIPEFVSSWTSSLEIAQRFRECDRDRTKVLMIFRRQPVEGDVILDLNAVYADPDFMVTVRAVSARLGRSYKGIERWRGTQQEVVLRETVIANDEIVSLGAFRDLTNVVPNIGERDPAAPSDAQILKELTGKLPTEHFWSSRASAATGIRAAADRIQVYLKDKQLWPEGV